jgi:hypothetical protein
MLYTYDRLDRMLTETNQLGFSRSHGYDAIGNQIEMVVGAASPQETRRLGANRGSPWLAFETEVRFNLDDEVIEALPLGVCPTSNYEPRRGRRSALMTVRLQYNQNKVRPYNVVANATYREPNYLHARYAQPHGASIPNP